MGNLRRDAAALTRPMPDDASEAADVWPAARALLHQSLSEGDPFDFLHWDVVRRTMIKRGRASMVPELRHLRGRSDWKGRWAPAVRESTIGHPRPFHLYPRSSGTLLHQAYHLCRFEETTGTSFVTLPCILEFGGGYGSLCRLFHQLGFTGTYVIFDLPEVSALQRFFLEHLGLPSACEPKVLPPRGVVTTSNVETLAALMSGRGADRAGFIATWSLSEAPLDVRAPVLDVVASFDAHLLAYQDRFGEIDNVAFFSQWRARLPEFSWSEIPISHTPKSGRYLVGVRR